MHLASYLDKLDIQYLSLPSISNILHAAWKDGCTSLLVSQNEYDQIARWVFYLGQISWDGKTVFGITVTVV